MNAEQLNSARLARWSQNGEARLTLETAAEWLDTIGFCGYLPMGVIGAAPSGSFLEAVVGRSAQNPSAGERSRALELLVRLIDNSSAVPLKLGASLGEQPDFVVSADVLRYVYALRGDRNFKTGPSTVGNEKVTPLALHCWQAIQEHGPLDIAALQPILGRDMTEAAIARALQELWTGMYVFPVLSAKGQPAQWELLSRRFPQQVAAGASTGHAESQSAMVSLYLHAVVAAAEEEILAFLSPLAPQSKLREVIRGLGSMRQLDIIDIGGRAHVCLQGGLLPEMVAQLSEEQLAASQGGPEIVESAGVTTGSFESGIEIEREPVRPSFASKPRIEGRPEEAKKFTPKKFVPKKFEPRESKTGTSGGKRFGGSAAPGGSGRFAGSRSDGDHPRRPRSFAAGAGDTSGYKGRDSGERAKSWGKSGEGAGSGQPARDRRFAPKPPFKSSGFKGAGASGFRAGGFTPAKPWASKDASSTDDGPRTSVSGYKKKPSGFKPGGFKSVGFKPGAAKPWQSKTGAPRFGAAGAAAAKPWAPRRSDESDTGGTGERSGSRPAARKSWGDKPPGRKPSGYTSSGFKSAGARSAEARSVGERSAGSKPWVSKGAESRVGSAKSYAARTSRSSDDAAPRGAGKSYGKSYGKAEGGKRWAKRSSSEGRGSESTGTADKPKRREKPTGASGAKAGEKRSAKPFWAKNPRGGKGSVPASRSNRPRVKNGGKKKGGKKK